MSERIGTRSREREPIKSMPYEKLMASREEYVQRQSTGVLLVKDSDREWELCRQGYVRFFLDTVTHPETALQDWCVFDFDVRKQSGTHRHQGGLVIMAIEGKGATEVDGELIEWEAGDLILLPIKPKGCTHRHFQRGDAPAKWLAFLYIPQWDHCGSEMTQVELNPEFTRSFGA